MNGIGGKRLVLVSRYTRKDSLDSLITWNITGF